MPKEVNQEGFCARGAVNHLIGASDYRVSAVAGQFRSTQRWAPEPVNGAKQPLRARLLRVRVKKQMVPCQCTDQPGWTGQDDSKVERHAPYLLVKYPRGRKIHIHVR